MNTVEGGGLRVAPRIVRTIDDLTKEVSLLSRHDTIVLDVETNFAHPKVNEISWIGFAVPDRVVLIPMGHPLGRMTRPPYHEKRIPPDKDRRLLKSGQLSSAKKNFVVPATYANPGIQLRPDTVFDALRPLLFSDRVKVGHNVKFDVQSIAKYYGGSVLPGPYVDTIIMTQVLDENLDRFGLKDLVMDWLRVPPNPKIRSSFYPNLGKLGVAEQPIDQVARYLAKDVWYTHLFYREHFFLMEGSPGLRRAFDLEMSLYPVLMDMELRGIRIDTDALGRAGVEYEHDRLATAGRIWSICGEQFPISNPTSKRNYLFGSKKSGGQGLKPLSFSPKTRSPQVNQATLEHYAPTNELARLLLEWTEKDKLISTFITGLSERMIRGRLHTSFNQHRAVTGRLSSTNPNLQQIPRGGAIRGTFVADPGHMVVVADYDQVELRCAAFLSGDEEMVRVFLEGRDIHAQAAAAMLGVSLDSVTKEQRQIGKTQNFGTLYGAGPGKLAAVADCSLEEAKEFIDRYFQQFSGLASWKDSMVVKSRNTGKRGDPRSVPYAVIPPFGRRRRLPDLYSEDHKLRARAERQVVNSIVQGFAANVMKQALIDLHTALMDTPFKLLLNVHDEVLIQAPEDLTDEARSLLVKTMEGVQFDGRPMLGPVPLTAEAGVGVSWADAK